MGSAAEGKGRPVSAFAAWGCKQTAPIRGAARERDLSLQSFREERLLPLLLRLYQVQGRLLLPATQGAFPCLPGGFLGLYRPNREKKDPDFAGMQDFFPGGSAGFRRVRQVFVFPENFVQLPVDKGGFWGYNSNSYNSVTNSYNLLRRLSWLRNPLF